MVIDEVLGCFGIIVGGVYKFFIVCCDLVIMFGMFIFLFMGLVIVFNF